MGDSWAWAAYMYADELYDDEQRKDQQGERCYCDANCPCYRFGIHDHHDPEDCKMDNREADDAIMAKYVAASSSQQEAIDASAKSFGMYKNTIDSKRALETMNKPMVNVESHGPKHTDYEILSIPNEQALRVINSILPKALELYLNKSKDYGGNVMSRINLGPKACIPDIQRKFGKLVDAIWFDKPLQFEQPEEILMDLLGHILIILDEMEQAKDVS